MADKKIKSDYKTILVDKHDNGLVVEQSTDPLKATRLIQTWAWNSMRHN